MQGRELCATVAMLGGSSIAPTILAQTSSDDSVWACTFGGSVRARTSLPQILALRRKKYSSARAATPDGLLFAPDTPWQRPGGALNVAGLQGRAAYSPSCAHEIDYAPR